MLSGPAAATEHTELAGLYWLTKLSTNQTWPVYRNIEPRVKTKNFHPFISESCGGGGATFTDEAMTGLLAMTPDQTRLRQRMVTRGSPMLSRACSSWGVVTTMMAGERGGACFPGPGAGYTSPGTGTGSMTPVSPSSRDTPGQ